MGADPKPSPDLLDILNDVLGKQYWLREYKKSEGASELSFVGRFDTTDSEAVVAKNMRATLGVDDCRRQVRSGDEFMRNLVRSAEASGIAVMRSGVVRGNNRRPLERGEFRGFSISDRVASLVFIQHMRRWRGPDLYAGPRVSPRLGPARGACQIRTMDFSTNSRRVRWSGSATAFAAETLVPSGDFLARWRSGDMSLRDNLDSLRRYYKVSSMVVLRQALDNDLIDTPEYQKRCAQLIGNAEAAEADHKSTDEGDDKSFGNF